MLQAIRDRTKGWLGISIVVLIGLPFALWGINSYFSDAGPRYIAKVDGTEISSQYFERQYSVQRQQLQKQFGGKLPISENMLRQRTITQLINTRLLENSSYSKGYRISDTMLAERIKQQFTIDGVFNRQEFNLTLSGLGMNSAMFEQLLRNELRLDQFQNGLTQSAFVTKQSVTHLAKLYEQTRDIDVFYINVEHFLESIEPTDEEIKQYYFDNKPRLKSEEKVKVDYVEITGETLAKDIKIDETQVKSMYENYVASANNEERKVRHILINVATSATDEEKSSAKVKIKQIQQSLSSGEDFAQLAEKHSQDSSSAKKGGDLGWVAPGVMVKEFDAALFDMKKGQVSDIVSSQFGYHLIKLDDIKKETVISFEVKKLEFEEELKAEKISSLFYDEMERLANITYENPDSLDVASQELGLEIKTTDFFTRQKGDLMASNNKIRQAAFSAIVLSQGNNSDVIELSPTHVVVLRKNKYIEASTLALETVSEKIKNIIKINKASEQANNLALDIQQKVEAGEQAQNITITGVEQVAYKNLARNDSAKVKDASIVQRAFEMIKTENKISTDIVNLNNADVALIVLNSLHEASQISDDKKASIKNSLMNETAMQDFSSALLAIKEKADIKINQSALLQDDK